MQNNGVVRYVVPLLGDKVFEGPALSISGLGDATVQMKRFLPKGNGGDSLTICVPKKTMTAYELVGIAAAFNTLHAWRFSFGRKSSARRIALLEIPSVLPETASLWKSESASISELAVKLGDLD